MLTIALSAIAALLMLGPLGAVPSRARAAGSLVYGACAVLSTVLLAAGCGQLLAGGGSPELVLPLGLPWIGAHFHADALASSFLIVVNLGGAAASLFAIGYGRHEEAPRRVLPFYPLFLAGMNLVVLAADAFTFLLSWEFMSLASWALVLAQHRVSENVRASYVYLMMAGCACCSPLD
jgi:hydrogenase-4 component B